MATKEKTTKKKTAKRKVKSNIPLSNTKKPSNLTVKEWQTILRKQIVEKSLFDIRNVGEGLLYSDYKVFNQTSKNTYKVALRSADSSLNFCACYDFKTNQLGTCKHIEAVLAQLNKKPAYRKMLQQPYSTGYSSMYIQYRGERKVMFKIGTENSTEYKKLLKPFVDNDNCLNKNGYEKIDQLIKKAYQINASFRCYEDALAHIIELREQQQRLHFLTPFIKKQQLPVIKSLKVKPFPYQIEGILFCAAAGRSILADDMGLGKTIQAIAVAQLLKEQQQIQKVLIICPTSLKYQWQSEIEKFTKEKATVIEGNFLKRRAQYEHNDTLYKIASYHMAVNDMAEINSFQPDFIILDEAQRIKNWQTKVSQSIKKLKSKYALVLTGTPLENKLQELYSLVQFVNPLLLGSLYNFITQFEQVDLNLIKEKLKHVLIRRTKKEVLKQLPTRIDKNLFVDITVEQKAIHNDYAEIVNRLVTRWRKMGFLREEERQQLMICLNMMRMVCNSTYIIDQETNFQTKLDELFNIVEEVVANTDEKIVIFSQWERFTRLIALELDRLNIGYANLNGNIPSNKRKDLFEKFNNDPNCRIFLSTDAGGVGLNLQAASYLINMDLPWNPAVLEQRIGRIYRQGQKRNVNIINFVAQHTIEHGMLSKLKFKAALAEGVLDNGDANIFIGDSKFNVFMQSVEELFVAAETSVGEITTDEKEEKTLEKVLTSATHDDGRLDEAVTSEITKESAAKIEPTTDIQTNQFLESASSFISNLTKIFSDSNATENLVKSLTRKDESTGQSYLQIPVESEAVVKNAISLIAGLFKGMVK
jgi:SNF2 family DNA or RNA helicase